MPQFLIGLALLIVLPWTIFACRGCNAKMETMRNDLEIEKSAYEKGADRRRDAVRKELAEEDQQSVNADRRRRNEIIEELNRKKRTQTQEIERLQKAIVLRSADREFQRVINAKMANEYKEFQKIGSDISYARKLLDATSVIAGKAGKATTDEFRSISAKVEKAQSDLDRVGRSFLEAAALLQIEEKQYSP